jgi:hypothetical protein
MARFIRPRIPMILESLLPVARLLAQPLYFHLRGWHYYTLTS